MKLPYELLIVIVEFNCDSFKELLKWYVCNKRLASLIDSHCDRTWAVAFQSQFSGRYKQFSVGKPSSSVHRGVLYVQLLKYEAQGALLKRVFDQNKQLCNQSAVDSRVFKVSILGAPCSGKTLFASRLCSFDLLTPTATPEQLSTQCFVPQLQTAFKVDISLRSQSSFAHVYIIVYDVTSRSSFSECKRIVHHLLKKRSCDTPVLIVGNKIDQQKTVRLEHVQQHIERIGVQNYSLSEVSALSYIGVEESLQKALLLAKRVQDKKNEAKEKDALMKAKSIQSVSDRSLENRGCRVKESKQRSCLVM